MGRHQLCVKLYVHNKEHYSKLYITHFVLFTVWRESDKAELGMRQNILENPREVVNYRSTSGPQGVLFTP